MQPTLFFTHANGFPAGSYRKFLEPLRELYRVEALPQLAHDPRYPVADNWAPLADELLAALDSIPGPVIGIGHSLGGVVTFLAAQRRPERFRAFVMLDPPIRLGSAALAVRAAKKLGIIDRLTPAGLSSRRRSEWPDRAAALAALRSKPLFRRFDPACLADYIEAGTVEHAGGVKLRYSPDIEAEIFRTVPHDLGRYRTTHVPGALIHAEQSVARTRDIRRLARRHRLLLREQHGGHMFPLERPHQTAEMVKAMITRLLEQAEQTSVAPATV